MKKFICDNAFNLKKNVLIMRPSRLCVFSVLVRFGFSFWPVILLWISLGKTSPPSSHFVDTMYPQKRRSRRDRLSLPQFLKLGLDLCSYGLLLSWHCQRSKVFRLSWPNFASKNVPAGACRVFQGWCTNCYYF